MGKKAFDPPNMLLHNAYLLNNLYGCMKLGHEEYIKYIAKYLLRVGSLTATIQRPPVRTYRQNVLSDEMHLPQKFPEIEGSKRKPSRPCFACNGSWADIKSKRIPKKCSGIWCSSCKKVLCATPCFQLYHTDPNYNITLLELRFPGVYLPN